MIETPHTTRFAPSPTGGLHLGHARAALIAWDMARATGGTFILRIEDLDASRVRPEYEQAIYDDLKWLGFKWNEPVMRQSERTPAYLDALHKLRAKDLVYPCFCTRKEIEVEFRASLSAPHGPPTTGPDGPLYPGTCKHLAPTETASRIKAGEAHALRLHMDRAMDTAPGSLTFVEMGSTESGAPEAITARPEIFGDVVLARKDAPSSYHLAVVVDDAAQGITLVTRADDLFAATFVHRILQELLDLPVPDYLHHDLVCDADGNRLAKRHDALSLAKLRADGETIETIRARFPKPVTR